MFHMKNKWKKNDEVKFKLSQTWQTFKVGKNTTKCCLMKN